MRLKKLSLHGFKTFADKTEIEFAEGVTAVVGPNGSGKSNIADAILWALGEQKASALRGSKAQDVIFAGADKRKPMGMAEVSLTVDNSDAFLPIDFSEVTITRRVYRTGDGEYFLNKVPCRLKDIYELFLDTGVGRESYALVNQSEIDAVLSANPEDRRGLFEEAAGIKKYRVKKREALRKLEATEGNLQRVQDILGEIEVRLEPLRVQAERARRHREIRERLSAIESSLLIVDLRFVDSELNAIRKSREAGQAQAGQQTAAIEAREAQTQLLAENLAEAETRLDSCRQQYQAALTQAERAGSDLALAAQRAEALAAAQRLLLQELDEIQERRTHLRQQTADAAEELGQARAEEELGQRQVAEFQAAVQTINRQLEELTRQAERRRAEALALVRQQAARQSEVARAEARVAELETSLPALREESVRLERAVQELIRTGQETRETVESARSSLVDAETKAGEALAAREAARQSVQTSQAQVTAAHSQSVTLTTRLRTLQDLEDAQEGYFAGVKAVFEAKKHGALRGDFTVVADAFQTPSGYETALETALAASLQDIITDTEEAAKAAIGYLHENRLGRATFLPLNRMRPGRDTLDLDRAMGLTGVRGAVLDIVQFDPKYRPALDVLLGRVFICETLDDALRASTVAKGWNRIVTLTGELVLPTGALTGGRQAGRGTGNLLGRKTEITKLKSDLKTQDRETAVRRAALEAAEKARDAAETALSEAQAQKQLAQLAVSEAGRQADYTAAEARRAQEQWDQAKRRLEAGQVTLAQVREQAAVAGAALASGGVESAEADDTAAAEATLIQNLTAERETVQADLVSARIHLATVTEKVISLARTLNAGQGDERQLVSQEERRRRQHQEAAAEYALLIAQTEQREAEALRSREASALLQETLLHQTEARQALRLEAEAERTQLRTLYDARSAALEAIHTHELREAKLGVQREQVAARLWEEYEISLEAALSLSDDPDVADGAPQEVTRLRREMRQIGDVNSAAGEEYEEVQTRYQFLTEQRADLDEARAKILAAIQEIDASTRGVFLDTFHAVGQAFDRIFTRLFGGGRTELVLTHPDDLLETGVDILVQPPGKKRQNLALLSGGERALTATALLFAFLEVKPSPFCVMDEVDAPLDGANVERFADLLRDFGQKSQFIIITHNPTTMEAAPLWYGVTMPDAGISRVLSLQVPVVADAPEPDRNGMAAAQ